MAIENTPSCNTFDKIGLSTDVKPTQDMGSGSTFYELDTKKVWQFSKLNINPVTGDGWWEV
jgi:hypothetical protein